MSQFMGHWGVRSYENDDAADALDAGFERVHGDLYDELMDDGNPSTPEQIQAKLASAETLAAGVDACVASVGRPWDEWDEEDRLGFVGVVVRHAELGVAVPDEWRDRALAWLRDESIDWDEATLRQALPGQGGRVAGRPPRPGSGG